MKKTGTVLLTLALAAGLTVAYAADAVLPDLVADGVGIS